MRTGALACLRRAAGVVAVSLIAVPAHAALFLVSTHAELTAAINAANATPGPDTIRFTADISVDPITFPTVPEVTTILTIDGAGHKFSRISVPTGPAVDAIYASATSHLRLVNLTVEGWGYPTTLVGAGAIGLVRSFGTLEVIGCTFINNRPGGASAVHAFGPGRVIASRFEANAGDPNGFPVALLIEGGGEIVNSVFHANLSFDFTGTDGATVAYIYGPSAVVRQSTFSNNVVGGNPVLIGDMQVIGTTFSGNTAAPAARSGVIQSTGPVAATNSTFTGNTLQYVFRSENPSSPITANNVTVHGNVTVGTEAPFGTGSVTITNSLLAGNSGGDCSFVAIQSGNASPDPGCPGAVPVAAGVDFSATAAANGGPTLTHALLAGSSAIDVVVAGGTSADQRGRTRAGAFRDAGAFEFGSAATYPTVQFAAAGATVSEGNSLAINLSVTGAANFTGIARVYVIDTEAGTASLGTDYVDGALREVVIDCSTGTCPATVSFNLTTTADAPFEGDETVSFRIVATDGLATLGAQSTFTATILDSATVTVSATDASATENPADNGRFTVDLGKVNSSAAPIVVSYTVAGTAAAGADYTALAGSVAIPVGQQTADIIVVPINDPNQEPAETVVVTLTGTNHPSVGVSATPATVTIVDGLEHPGVPTAVAAVAGNTTATISFAAPASDGGSPITAYTVTCLPGPVTGTGAASPIVVTGLANGTPYTCSVTATNGVGTGAASATVAVTPLTVPGAPAITSATPGNGQAVIAFTPPAVTGGSPITGYTASCAPGPFTATGAASPLTVNGLANGTTYTCSVTATNAVGTGAASTGVAVTPVSVPGAPAITSATPGNGQAVIAFTPPAITGGSPITGYTASCAPGPFAATGAASPLTVNGLANGTTYSCTVTATNVVGTGPASAAASLAPGTRTYTAASATGSGMITATFTGGGATCFYANPQFIPLTGHAASPPAGSAPAYAFPHGLFDFRTTGCTPGSTITMTITYPAAITAGSLYWKYGPEPGDTTPHWYPMPATIAGNTVTFAITDGMRGDDDLTANGTIIDQGGPGFPVGAAAPIPTLSPWALLMLALLMLAIVGDRRGARRPGSR